MTLFSGLQKISESLRISMIFRREAISKKRPKNFMTSPCFVYISIPSILENEVDMCMLAKTKMQLRGKILGP